jgi:tRNA-2-methylthio-N6-dimethylallyladenosine synthase
MKFVNYSDMKLHNNYYIETFGCQMNKSDSELIALSMERAGFIGSVESEADILVFNTCSVRHHAENRAIFRMRSSRAKLKKNSVIVLAGCMAQRMGQELLDKKLVDLVVGPYESPKIGEILTGFISNRKKNKYDSLLNADFQSRIDFELAEKKDDLLWHKWVTITHGCENFCSYCIVPYVRGGLISIPPDTIIEYVKRLAGNGVREITLLGQNVNQYGGKGSLPFYRLLEAVSKINELARINFLTSHPKDFDENIIRVIRDRENISRSIHLPLQSGSDVILQKMNRQYTAKHYLNITEKISNVLDAYSVTTDIIVGFPGESEDDFKSTLDIVKQVQFDDAFMYAYSPREGTRAYNYKETLTGEEKINRLNILIDLQREISRKKMNSRMNCREDVIIEKISKRSNKEVMGKTFLNHPAVTSGTSEDIGKKIGIIITELKGNTLYGKRIA